jgi:hypothetical protein
LSAESTFKHLLHGAIPADDAAAGCSGSWFMALPDWVHGMASFPGLRFSALLWMCLALTL